MLSGQPSARETMLPSSPGPQLGGGSVSGLQKITVQSKPHLLISLVPPILVSPAKTLISSLETQTLGKKKKKKLSGNDSSLKMVLEEIVAQMLQQRDPSDARNPHEDQES